jgi:ABC-2 type transport system ATP-binding protein
MHAITSDSLSKTYRNGLSKRREIKALQDFTISVEEGQIFSLLGPNGAGKTTFIKILLSIVHPTAGSASILGKRLPDIHVKDRVGYLPENHRFPGYLTAEQALMLFGQLSSVRHSKVKRYSKGMLQRLGLAQALINDPQVIFLDEPTDGVDPIGRKEIRDVLLNLKQQGKTVFLNSHLLSEVELISDGVAIIDRGKLLKVGSVHELTTTESQYQIGIGTTPPEAFKAEASALLLKLTYGVDGVTAELRNNDELNRLIDLLRKHQVEIHSIAKKRSTLEESFLNLIKREAAQ